MSKKLSNKALAATFGAVAISFAGGVQADTITNPFKINELGSGFMVAAQHTSNATPWTISDYVRQAQTKNHEGNCGDSKGDEGKCGEGKCGDNKQS